jgi:4-hydroxybenzoate polyprenyltransferase
MSLTSIQSHVELEGAGGVGIVGGAFSSGARASRVLVALGRPRTCAVCGLAYIFGYLEGHGTLGWLALPGAIIALLVPFAGNIHNTLTDYAEDALNLPGRSQLVTAAGAARLRAFVGGSCVAVLVVSAGMGLWSCLVSVGYVGGLLQYSSPPVRAKRYPFFGLVIFAQVVALPFVHGLVTVPLDRWAEFDPARSSVALTMEWLFLTAWFVAKGLVKNLPDREGDAAAGLRTSATLSASSAAAARLATLATAVVYIAAPLLGLGRTDGERFLLLWLWVPIAVVHVARMIGADALGANQLLRTDMVISAGFAASACLLVSGSLSMWLAAGVILLLIPLADIANIDSRRQRDMTPVRG